MAEHLKMTEATLAAFGTLYKYRDANNAQHWEILEKQELFFPNPASFNDPFDANIGMRYDLLPAGVISKMIEDYVRSKNPGAGHFLLQGEVRRLNDRLSNPAIHDEAMQRWMNRLISKMRVFCICPDRGNILLWSHYSFNHTGFAIGFNTMKLYDLWSANRGLMMGHVAYSDTYPVLLPPGPDDRSAKEDIVATIMNLKSDIWAYEKEIRMTMYGGPEKASFDPSLINEVVLGCKMNTLYQDRMLRLMDDKYPHASVCRAKMHRSAFALDFEQLRG